MTEVGKLFIFEGPDGVGKTTLIQNTADLLRVNNISFISLSFPGKTPGTLGYLIDRVHHTPAELEVKEITPLAVQALHIAAHLDAIEIRIKPALDSGIAVLLDRTWWSTLVYGRVTKVNKNVLIKLIEAEELCWGEITPATLFLVQRASAFRAEHDEETFDKLSRLYEEVASSQELRHPVVRISNDDLQVSTDIIRQSILPIFNIPLHNSHDNHRG